MIENSKIKGGKLIGYISLPFINNKILVKLDLENENKDLSYEDFNNLSDQLRLIVKKIDLDKMNLITDFISREVIDSSYSQSGYKPTNKDYQELKKELEILHIDFYESDFLIFFKAENSFPEMKISIQLEEDLELSDAEVIVQ